MRIFTKNYNLASTLIVLVLSYPIQLCALILGSSGSPALTAATTTTPISAITTTAATTTSSIPPPPVNTPVPPPPSTPANPAAAAIASALPASVTSALPAPLAAAVAPALAAATSSTTSTEKIAVVKKAPIVIAPTVPLNGQTVQINTHFNCILGHPTWLLILRDVESGITRPNIFDMDRPEDFYMAVSTSSNYEVSASQLKFGKYAVINNFCHLECCQLINKSIFVTLTGTLTPNRNTSHCMVQQFTNIRTFT